MSHTNQTPIPRRRTPPASNRGMNDWMEWNSCDKIQQVTLNRNHSPSLRHVTIHPFLHPSPPLTHGKMNPLSSSWRANHHGVQPTYAIRHCCAAERELSLKFIKAPTEQENATHTVTESGSLNLAQPSSVHRLVAVARKVCFCSVAVVVCSMVLPGCERRGGTSTSS